MITHSASWFPIPVVSILLASLKQGKGSEGILRCYSSQCSRLVLENNHPGCCSPPLLRWSSVTWLFFSFGWRISCLGEDEERLCRFLVEVIVNIREARLYYEAD